MENLKEKTARGLMWGGIANGLQQVLNLAFGICLGRLLLPSDYGMVGMLAIFSAMAAALEEGGFMSALNKRKNPTHEDYNSVFWFSTLTGLTCYAILFLCAPLIADFYHRQELAPLARFVFLGFLITSLNVAPRAYMFRNLKVKQNSLIILCALLISGTVGVVMAWKGFAYWGLATQTVVYTGVITILSFIVTRWCPSLKVSFKPVREMLGFSSRLIVTNVFNIINQNIFPVTLGRTYGDVAAGNFTQANKWNYMGHVTITNMLWGVAQPVFTKVEDDAARQLAVFRKLLRFTALFSFPALFGLSLIAHEFIVLALGGKWDDSATLLQMLCIWGAFVPIQSLCSNLIISRGRSSIYMWTTIALALTSLAAVLLCSPLGLEWMVRVFVAINILWLLVWHYFVRREIGLSLYALIADLLPYAALAGALCIGTHFLTAGMENLWLRMAAKILIVGAAYCLVLWASGSVIFRESMEFIFRKKKNAAEKNP